MCGILAALGVTGDVEANRRLLLRQSRLLRHRGPDSSGVYEDPKGRAFFSFERLNIVDPSDNGRHAGAGPRRCSRHAHELIPDSRLMYDLQCMYFTAGSPSKSCAPRATWSGHCEWQFGCGG